MFFLVIFIVPFILPITIFLVLMSPKYFKFRESEYMLKSNNNFSKTMFNKGNYGEYLTFTYLEKLNGYNKIITNLYIPKDDSTITEIDLIMINATGIYVFESKNYSGWIFGNQNHKYWTQSLNKNHKYKFYNPIWQNNGHVKALQRVLGFEDKDLFKSYIVFSERCELKNISVNSSKIKVLKRSSLLEAINIDIANSPITFSNIQIGQLHLKLQEFTYTDDKMKQIHASKIREYK